jgi:hypothetical protein
MLPRLETIQLLRETETDGHSPMQFICSDNEVYYLKYRSGKSFDSQEFNFLIYEVFCAVLLQELSIPVPPIALVKLIDGSFESKQLKANRRYAKADKICFASKEIPNSQLVMDFEIIDSQEKFKRIANPMDLIKIAIFDIWVDNADRGKKIETGGCNYNLLLKPIFSRTFEGSQILAFDHAFAFGGQSNTGILSDKMPVSAENKLIKSDYFRSFMLYMPHFNFSYWADCFINECQQIDTQNILETMQKHLPEEWYVNEHLNDSLYHFLKSPFRWHKIKKIIQTL